MKSLNLIAIAAVMSWVALSGKEASAQAYYGYPTTAPLSQSYAPSLQRCGYTVPGTYGNSRPYPAGVPSSLDRSNRVPYGQYGWPAYSYPQSGYGVPLLTQPTGSYGVPVYRPAVPGAGQFSVEDRFTAPPTTTVPRGLNPGTLRAPPAVSPFYQNPGAIVPAAGYAPAGSYPTGPINSAPTNNSPFYR